MTWKKADQMYCESLWEYEDWRSTVVNICSFIAVISIKSATILELLHLNLSAPMGGNSKLNEIAKYSKANNSALEYCSIYFILMVTH